MAEVAAKTNALNKGYENHSKTGENSSHNLHAKPNKRVLVWYSVSHARKWDTISGTVQKRRRNKTTPKRGTSLKWNVTHVRVQDTNPGIASRRRRAK